MNLELRTSRMADPSTGVMKNVKFEYSRKLVRLLRNTEEADIKIYVKFQIDF